MDRNDWIALALVAAAIWAAWFRMKRPRAAAAGWTETTGWIVSHDVVEDTGTDSDGAPPSWKPKLGYEYEVGGHLHGGSRLAIGGKGFGSRKGAQAWLNERPVGSSIPVYVNSADPSDSIPNIRSRRGWWAPALFIALAIEVEAGLFGS